MSKTTLARPLSADRIVIVSSYFRFLRASCILFVMLVLGDLACRRIPFTVRFSTVYVCSESSALIADSTLATISLAGMLNGITAKFNPFFGNNTSISLRGREDKSITHLFLST